MVAAVQCGADAVYLGAGDFNARRTADNFENELEAAVLYCQARGARVYVTLNTMVRHDELPRLEATIGEICRAGADGVIVADLGTARAIRQMAPSLPLHASTQMAAHNPQAVEFLAEQGFKRVVLAREMDFEEIARCANRGAELEVFVHGALCVSCSGQCLLSSMIGGRSGNRGLCAQPCRMRYSLDGREGHLLSTRDLCTLDELRSLAQAGASSLKIEGRLKRPEYVAQTVTAYRAALNDISEGAPFDAETAKRELRQMFNRGGFTRGYGPGAEDQKLMYHERPNHLGVEIGRCRKNGEIELSEAVDEKDALVLRRPDGSDVPVRMRSTPSGCVLLPEARRGDALVRLVSQAQMRAARESFLGERRKFPVDARMTLHVGMPAALELSDGARNVHVEGEIVQAAQSRPADPVRIRAQIEKLGDTPFVLRNWSAEIDANAYIPVSALNALRRHAAERLLAARGNPPHDCAAMALPALPKHDKTRPELIAQSGDPELLRRALGAGADFAAFSPEDLRTEALDAALDLLPQSFDLALPPVMSETTLNEIHHWAQAHAGRIRRVLISNIGQLGLNWPGETAGDHPLNIANDLSVQQLRDWGIRRYTPSVELNRSQIASLGGERELIVYGSLPLMQLRHCPLRAVEGMKGLHRSCRRCDGCAPADHVNEKSFTDRTGARFPLRRIASDAGCVVQLLNSAKLMLLRRHASLPAASGWRLLLDRDDPAEAVVRLHRVALDGGDPREDADWPKLDQMNTTTGHYFRGAE